MLKHTRSAMLASVQHMSIRRISCLRVHEEVLRACTWKSVAR